jgi:hypothetical protein
MNRIATRLALSLLYGVLVGAALSACASEDSTFRPIPDSGVKSAGGAAGASASGKPACKPEFCPTHAPATPCCATAYDCGLDWGTGTCIPNSKKDGGQ